VRESLSTKIETIKVCHALLQNPKFFSLLLQIDIEEAAKVQSRHCPCGAVLHKADYPRKPRGCPREVRPDFETRLSFCCSRCRKRTTAMSVRFLGRRLYLGLIVVLMSMRRTTLSASAVQMMQTLGVPERTIARWRHWWRQVFPTTPLWQAVCARFMPPVQTVCLPCSLIERFTGVAAHRAMHLLVFLTPLSVQPVITLCEGR
jgi:hypothetical protein